ncbi:hypothetical protein E2C01_013862 [Portunus trituberculatus]|uniref:Uncharacterized protein n=1 Tax=Portunus trituberculatus TaxID=210409 RepID=A0A5B7DHQ4_PORTR|nr:hypothetical protein [Portunus trituberculatus]
MRRLLRGDIRTRSGCYFLEASLGVWCEEPLYTDGGDERLREWKEGGRCGILVGLKTEELRKGTCIGPNLQALSHVYYAALGHIFV